MFYFFFSKRVYPKWYSQKYSTPFTFHFSAGTDRTFFSINTKSVQFCFRYLKKMGLSHSFTIYKTTSFKHKINANRKAKKRVTIRQSPKQIVRTCTCMIYPSLMISLIRFKMAVLMLSVLSKTKSVL